jgi:hypothetical protein
MWFGVCVAGNRKSPPQPDRFLKSQPVGSSDADDTDDNIKDVYVQEEDEVSVSTLGMEGFDEERSPGVDESGKPRKKKTVRFGAVTTAGEKESVSVTKMFRELKGRMVGG